MQLRLNLINFLTFPHPNSTVLAALNAGETAENPSLEQTFEFRRDKSEPANQGPKHGLTKWAKALCCAVLIGSGIAAQGATALVSQDTGVYQFSDSSLGGGLGTTLYAIDSGGVGHDFLSYIQFDLSSLGLTSGSQVTNAKMWLQTKTSGAASNAAGYLQVKDVTQSWAANSVTFSSPPTVGSFLSTSYVDTTLGWYSVDLTSLVAQWINTPASNLGVQLTALAGTGGSFIFNSSETASKPYLEVTSAPEPGRALLGFLGMAVIGLRRRRRAVTA